MYSNRPTWEGRVRHIIDAALEILQLTERMSFDEFCRNALILHACSYDFIIIGEAVRHLPSRIIAGNPQVSWAKMRGMRNVVVHEYESIDLETVWDTITQDLPLLVSTLEALLEAEGGTG